MNFESIQYDVRDQILALALNRRDRLNAVTDQMLREMIDAFDRADRDDGVRAVVVTGAGVPSNEYSGPEMCLRSVDGRFVNVISILIIAGLSAQDVARAVSLLQSSEGAF